MEKRRALNTPRLYLRPFQPEDLEDFYEYCSQEGVGEAAGWKHHGSIGESGSVLEAVRGRDDFLAVVYKDENKVIGHISLCPEAQCGAQEKAGRKPCTVGLGFALNRKYQGRGIMTEAVRRLTQKLSAGGGNPSVRAACLENNRACARLLEKCGFIREGTGSFYSATLDRELQTAEYKLPVQGPV